MTERSCGASYGSPGVVVIKSNPREKWRQIVGWLSERGRIIGIDLDSQALFFGFKFLLDGYSGKVGINTPFIVCFIFISNQSVIHTRYWNIGGSIASLSFPSSYTHYTTMKFVALHLPVPIPVPVFFSRRSLASSHWGEKPDPLKFTRILLCLQNLPAHYHVSMFSARQSYPAP